MAKTEKPVRFDIGGGGFVLDSSGPAPQGASLSRQADDSMKYVRKLLDKRQQAGKTDGDEDGGEADFGLNSFFEEAAREAGITHPQAIQDLLGLLNEGAKEDGWDRIPGLNRVDLVDFATLWWEIVKSKYQRH